MPAFGGDPATPDTRVGIGHDTHRLAPGGPLRLGGVDIPHDRETAGHSDADALLHAAIDEAIARKPKGHDFIIDRQAKPSVPRHMSATGG